LKISLIGNCQLEVLGQLIIQNQKTFEPFKSVQIVWNTPLYKLNKENIVDLFSALEKSDVIYHQYHSSEWGSFSTENLKKYFDLKTLPTLESIISSPQLAYWKTGGIRIPPSYVYVDFRFLEMYLNGFHFNKAAIEYTSSSISFSEVEKLIFESAERYRKLYETKKVLLDYSSFYKENLIKNQDDFFTLSHPNNRHLSFILNSIFHDVGMTIDVTIKDPELLRNAIVPKMGTNQTEYIMQRPLSLELASKLYYEYFSSFEESFLIDEYTSSNYYKLITA